MDVKPRNKFLAIWFILLGRGVAYRIETASAYVEPISTAKYPRRTVAIECEDEAHKAARLIDERRA